MPMLCVSDQLRSLYGLILVVIQDRLVNGPLMYLICFGKYIIQI